MDPYGDYYNNGNDDLFATPKKNNNKTAFDQTETKKFIPKVKQAHDSDDMPQFVNLTEGAYNKKRNSTYMNDDGEYEMPILEGKIDYFI